jgi:hypothetical protein
MKRARIRSAVVASCVAAIAMFGAPAAHASHNCGLEEVPIVDTICDNYHSPKVVIQYVVYCVATSETHCV